MARESCNLDKEEAEILKPSSSPSSQPPSSSSSSSSPSPPSPPSPPPPSSASSPPLFLKPPQEFSPQSPQTPETPAAITPAKEPSPAVQLGNRCSSCRKRVGLTAFRCRCGDLFCDRHRYSDTHDCSFDYKAAAREQISKANPVIRAAKIIKI